MRSSYFCVVSVMVACSKAGAPSSGDASEGDRDARGDAVDVVDAMPSSGPFVPPFPATAQCMPVGNVCAAPAASGLFASYRKDVYSSQYAEANLPAPTAGGRIHIVASSVVTGQVTGVRINGQLAPSLTSSGYLDWFHVWPTDAVAGEPLWVSFHSRSTDFDTLATMSIQIETSAGVAASGMFPIVRTPVPLTYVTTIDGGTSYLIHVKNTDSVAHTLGRLVVDGRDVTASACIAAPTLAPRQSAMWRVPRCTPANVGSLWTVVAEWTDAPASTAGGRVVAEQFPIHTWPAERDCPFPGASSQNLAAHVARGFDTFFLRSAYTDSGCNNTTGTSIIANAANANIFLMPDEFISLPNGLGAAQRVPTRLMADEADSSNEDKRVTELAEQVQAHWRTNPTMATYVGGSRQRKNGRFAGSADIQGMDFYVAACAPHITPFGSHPPLRGAYDYLRITRENHMPLPTWLYTQGLHGGWNKSVLGLTTVRQPDPTEARIQAFSVVAAGGKGLMYFQTNMELANGAASATWAEIGRQNRDIRSVRQLLRAGDVTGQAESSDDAVIVELVRSPEALVLVAINTKNSGGIDDTTCAIPTNAPHWSVQPVTSDLSFEVPPDIAIADAFEVLDGAILPLPSGAHYDGRKVTLPALAFDAAHPTRMIVLAAKPTLRGQIQASF